MKRSRRSKRKKNALILLAIVAAATIIVVSAIKNQNNQNIQSKPPASEYLKVEHIGSIGEFYNNNRTVNIKELGLRVTALGGNATNIIITGLSTESEDYPYIQNLTMGESKELSIQLKSYITSLNDEGVFPLELTIGCSEATASDITIYLKPEDIKGPHY
jgi:hypothetical protein